MKYHIETAGQKYCVEAPTIEAAQIKWVRDFRPRMFGMFVGITPERGEIHFNLPEHILEMAGYVKEGKRYVLKGIPSYEPFKEPKKVVKPVKAQEGSPSDLLSRSALLPDWTPQENDDEPFEITTKSDTSESDWGVCTGCGTTVRRGQIHVCQV